MAAYLKRILFIYSIIMPVWGAALMVDYFLPTSEALEVIASKYTETENARTFIEVDKVAFPVAIGSTEEIMPGDTIRTVRTKLMSRLVSISEKDGGPAVTPYSSVYSRFPLFPLIFMLPLINLLGRKDDFFSNFVTPMTIIVPIVMLFYLK